MKAVILAAGKSTRTYPLTLTRPKPLLPLFNRPLLERNLDVLRPYVNGFVLVVGYFAEMVRSVFGNYYEGTPVEYVLQIEQGGTADAVLTAEPAVDADFLVLNADDIYATEDVSAVADSPGNALLGVEVDDPGRFGVLVAEGGKLREIIEKPEGSVSGPANAGLYRFKTDVFDYIRTVEPTPRGEYELVDAITGLAAVSTVTVVESTTGFLSVGTAADLLGAQRALWPGGDSVDGPDCQVASDAAVGPYVTVGAGCIFGTRASISNSILFDGVNIGVGVEVVDSVIGSGVKVGESAVLDGAAVGDGATIGPEVRLEPGSRVWPDTIVPPGSTIKGDFKCDSK
ncbi:MAG: NTP transferase domain-containing protein [Candidatus Coatesbacteria bacterium]|nr:MAG: NTP transferase domain-containing protein [Candidatus Coatesbacteria bacterium]